MYIYADPLQYVTIVSPSTRSASLLLDLNYSSNIYSVFYPSS
jgi:hypothetical protein